MTPNVGFGLADVDGEICIALRRYPCCGRIRAEESQARALAVSITNQMRGGGHA